MELRKRKVTEEEKLIAKIYAERYAEFVMYANVMFQAMVGASFAAGKSEDAVQEAFVVACMKQEELRTCEKPVHWIYGILKNMIRNMVREQSRSEKLMHDILREFRLIWMQNLNKGIELNLETEWKSNNKDDKNDKKNKKNKNDKEDKDDEVWKDLGLIIRLEINGEDYKKLSDELGVGVSCLGMRVIRAKKRIREYLKNL